MSAAKDRWLDEGLRVLEDEGAQGVRIDRIAARLGLSKGSFHHHFEGAAGFQRDLLDHYERMSVEATESAIRAVGDGASARDILSALTGMIRDDGSTPYRPKLDIAVRAWAASDPVVRATQARIDAARIDALEAVWRPVARTAKQARQSALLPYLLAVGASVAIPPIAADELRELYEILLPLVPAEPPTQPATQPPAEPLAEGPAD